jgi:adenylate cyclase
MSTWACSACGGENAEQMRFCGHCGAARAVGWTCASCGGENAPGTRFCGHCGAPSASTVEAAPTAEPDVADALRSFVAGQVADRLVETGGKLPEERRLITALFADVSGFTGLADRLDPEQLLEVIDPIVSALSSVVGRYEGYVEKFAGDALLALFGAPVTHEDDAARAVRVALEMHAELARICEGLPPENRELTLHVGINSGHGIARILGSEARMDYAVLGDSVILAQRLESAAPAGETYVSELTHRLTGDLFEFEPVGELALKGKAEPVPAWRLVGERATVAAAPRDGAVHELVGRERELEVVAAVLDDLAEGREAVLSVTGEAGVGKSRLREAAEAAAAARGIRWLQARCLSYGASLPYWPYTDLLRRVVGMRAEQHPEEAAQALATAFGEAPEVVPYFRRLLGLPSGEGDEVAGLDPEVFRRGLHDAFATWLRLLSSERPTILALEDLHWADASTLALTGELGVLSAAEALGVVLLGRPEAGPSMDAIAPRADRIELVPFDEADVKALLAAILGGAAPRRLASLVYERTDGNPFFVEELVRSLRETEALVSRNGHWRLRRGWTADDVPATVEGVLAARLDLLPRAAADLLQTAAVIGRRVPLPLLAAVAAEGEVEGMIDQLVVSRFVDRAEEDGAPLAVFRHALVQDVAYSRLLRRRRHDLHRRVAEAAEALYGAGDDTVDLLARHLYLGDAGAKAIDYLVRAGERARRLYANDEAIVHLARAAEVAAADEATTERLPEIELALAELYEVVGDYDEALQLYSAVQGRKNDLRAWRGLASTYRKQGDYVKSLDVVNRALATETLAGKDLAPLWLEAGWSLAVSGRYGEAIDVLAAGIEAVGDRRDSIVAELLVQLGRAEGVEGQYKEGLAHALTGKQIFEEEGDLPGLARTMRVLGDLYTKAKQFDEAADALRRGLELAERTGTVEEVGGCLINLALAEYNRGALDVAIPLQRRAIDEFERIGHASGRVIGYGNLAEMLVKAGEYDEALAMCERTIEFSREIGHPVTIADATDTIALLRREQGRFLEAAERAEEAATLYTDLGAAPAAAKSLALAAEAWEQVGELERARSAEDRARKLVPAESATSA